MGKLIQGGKLHSLTTRLTAVLIGAGLLYCLASSQAQLQSDTPYPALNLPLATADMATNPGTFWLAQRPDSAPLPFNPFPDLPVYVLDNGTLLLDDRSVDYIALGQERQARAALLRATARSLGMTTSEEIPGFDEEDGTGDYTSDYQPMVINTNGLWLELTNVADGLAYVNLHHATNQVYAIWSTTNLSGGWFGEMLVSPTNSAVMPFTVPMLGRTNLFLRAEDWTGTNIAPPYANDDPYESVCVNSTLTIYPDAVDPYYWPLTFIVVTSPAHGTLSFDTTLDEFIYIPTDHFAGTDWFSYKVSNGCFDSATATVTISVNNFLIAVYPNGDATNPAAPGYFKLQNNGTCTIVNDLPVYYKLSGSAVGGVDYSNLTGVVTIPANSDSVQIEVDPLNGIFDTTVTLTLVSSNDYAVDPGAPSATITIHQTHSTNLFGVVTSGLNWPAGMDYLPGKTNALIVSVDNNNPTLLPRFVRLYTNGVSTNLFIEPFSGVTNSNPEEMNFTTVKSNLGGFTTNWLYYGNGSPPQIGRVTNNGAMFTNSWATLSNSFGTLLDMCMDPFGQFGYRLVLAGQTDTLNSAVWLVNSNGVATNLAAIPDVGIEGVITLPNDTNKWGPWAGKIVMGAELSGTLYSVDTNGTVTNYTLGIAPPNDAIHSEDMDLIPANQDLYCADQNGSIWKLSRNYFTNDVGHLLITQEQNAFYGIHARLYIVSWNNSSQSFDIKYIPYPTTAIFEHVTFAPINLPTQ